MIMCFHKKIVYLHQHSNISKHNGKIKDIQV